MCRRVSRFTLRAADICRSADAELNFWTVLTRNDACKFRSRPIDSQLQVCELTSSCKKAMHHQQQHMHGTWSLLDLAALPSSVFSLHTAAFPQMSTLKIELQQENLQMKSANEIQQNFVGSFCRLLPRNVRCCAMCRPLAHWQSAH